MPEVLRLVDMLGKLASSERERDEAFWLDPFRIIRIFVSFASSVRRDIPWSAEDGLMSRSRVVGCRSFAAHALHQCNGRRVQQERKSSAQWKRFRQGFSTSELRTTSPPPS